MRHKGTVFLTLILVLLGAVLVGPARASQWNKKTIVTFAQAVEIPGGKVLPAGKYVFKLLDSMSNRNIVQIFNEDETEVFATILAINNYRLEPTGETVMEFKERPGNQPQALRAWFYPGDTYGQEFAYPKARAMQLAEASNEVVPAEEATTEPKPEELRSVPLVAVTPQHTEEPIAKAFEVTPPHEQPTAMTTEEKELPKGARPVPLVALAGFVAVALGLGLRMFVRRTS